MLRLDGTRLGRLNSLALPLLQLPLGIAGILLGAASLLFTLWNSPGTDGFRLFYDCWFGALTLTGGVVGAADGALKLRDNWFRGAVHITLMANSRTLAVVRYHAPTLFIKHGQCVALRHFGLVVVLADGREIALSCNGVSFRRLMRDFVEPLYAWWWPHTSASEVRKYFIVSRPSLTATQHILFVLIGAPISMLVTLQLFFGGWWSLIGIAMLLTVGGSVIIPPFRERGRKQRELVYPLTGIGLGPDADRAYQADYAED